MPKEILAYSAITAPTNWLEWPIWDFLSFVATMFGLIAIALAVGELRERRKRISATYLVVGSRGSGKAPDGTEFQAVTITNGGWAQINLLRIGIVGGRLVNVSGHNANMRWHLPPGESMEFNLAADDYDAVWFLICSSSVLDRTSGRWSWEPFTDTGPLAEAQERQYRPRGVGHRLRQALRVTRVSRLRAVRGVGPQPEGSYAEYLPATESDELEKANARVVKPFLEAGGELHSHRLSGDPRKS